MDTGKKETSSSTVGELIHEIGQYLQTCTDIFKTEIRERLLPSRTVMLLALGGALFLAIGYLLLAIAVVVLIGSAFPANPYRWFFGSATVGILAVGFGAIGAFLTEPGFVMRSLLPKHTLSVLKGDKDWVMSEIQRHK